MNVLSLFDGMSCGQIALEKSGIKIDKYYASEIKPIAIRVSKSNYPSMIHIGDVTNIDLTRLDKIDLLIGGSPCQDFSIARTMHTGELGERKGLCGSKSGLFYHYLAILRKLKPKYFLLENVRMDGESERQLNEFLGVRGIHINSSLVTFQSRPRIYWANIPNIIIPEDRNISYQDNKSIDLEYLKSFRVNKTPSREIMWGEGTHGKCPNVTNRDKVNCLTRKQDRWSNSGLVEYDGFCRYLTTEELEKAQTVPVGYTSVCSKAQSEDLLGDGWTVDVIAHIFSFLPDEYKLQP